ncbi:MAG: ankyrin repeat domain-containing protein [Treponema sp.]|jgi:hypothetical protein|nr:ankyrin repeat domain-containing protein [Treponema sp.]
MAEETFTALDLTAGTVYYVTAKFTDAGGRTYPKGESWLFTGLLADTSPYVPGESQYWKDTTINLGVETGGKSSCIPLIDTEQGQARLIEHFSDYVSVSNYHIAARCADPAAVEWLLNAGLKPCLDRDEQTPLHYLARCNIHGEDIEKRSGDIYRTALLLLDAGLDPNRRDMKGIAAYFDAGLNGLYPFIRAMADRKVRMDAVGQEGKNLLHAICARLYHRKSIAGELDRGKEGDRPAPGIGRRRSRGQGYLRHNPSGIRPAGRR